MLISPYINKRNGFIFQKKIGFFFYVFFCNKSELNDKKSYKQIMKIKVDFH